MLSVACWEDMVVSNASAGGKVRSLALDGWWRGDGYVVVGRRVWGWEGSSSSVGNPPPLGAPISLAPLAIFLVTQRRCSAAEGGSGRLARPINHSPRRRIWLRSAAALRTLSKTTEGGD